MALRLRRVPSAQWERLVAARSRYDAAPVPPRTQITAIELTLVELEHTSAAEHPPVIRRSGSVATS